MNRLARRSALAVSITLALASFAGVAQAQATDLIISEYVETNDGNNKAIEIYNGTSGPVDLSGYKLTLHANGAAPGSPSNTITFTPDTTLASGATWVVCNSSSTTPLTNSCNQLSGSITHNGDDGYVLRKTDNTPVDSFGQIGTDPGSGWGSGTSSTVDNTLRRKSTVCAGDTNLSDAFDPSVEWEGFGNKTYDGLGSHTAVCGTSGGTPTISIADASVAEGDSGTTILNFTVSLTAPAPEGGVSFQYSTASGTAVGGMVGDYTCDAGDDFQNVALLSGSIAEAETSTTVGIVICGDEDLEPNESFTITLSQIIGADEGTLAALGTILTDDVAILPINQIQGSGSTSPYAGQPVVTEGVVTQIRSNQFFIQSTAEHDDGDPQTSDGILVFNPAPAGVAVGDVVQVSGTVVEYTPACYPATCMAMPVTEFANGANIVEVGTAPLPAPVEITADMFSASLLTPDVLEHLEGMYVHVASGRIVAPGTGTIEIVVDGVDRPVREAGISIFDPYNVPEALEDTIPYFDANQERIKLFPAGPASAPASPAADARGTVTDVYGTLTYFGSSTMMDSWEINYDTATIVSGTAAAVSDPGPADITVAGYNMLRFGIDGNEANRRTKAAAVVCDWLKTPDILGVSEVDDITTLTALANEINGSCGNNPDYDAYLIEGNDVGGIDVGFLVNTAIVGGTTPRVEVVNVEQHGKTTMQKNQNGTDSDKLLNDRPPLRLQALVHFADGDAGYPLTVIAVHQRSLGNVDNETGGSGSLGYSTQGQVVRAKRAEQAAFVAQLVDDIQTGTIGGNPGEKVLVVGDFNSFEVNDGFVDAMGITIGEPAPADQVIHYAPSPLAGGIHLIPGNDLVADPNERYSYIYGNISQTLDHALISQSFVDDVANTVDVKVEHPRLNADFRVSPHYNTFNPPYTVANPPLRTSDHDPVRVSIHVGNRATEDDTAPTITAAIDGSASPSGWYKSRVKVIFTCDDGLFGSGVAVCPDPLVLKDNGANQSPAYRVRDAAGNLSAPANVVTVNIDTAKPAITAEATSAPNEFGWYTGDVTIHYTCVDLLSGIASCPDDTVITKRGAAVAVPKGKAFDVAGNSATSEAATLQIDSNAAKISSIEFSGPLVVGADVTASAVAEDSQSGIASSTCEPVDTSKAKKRKLTCTVTNGAGLVATKTVHYTVVAAE